MVRNRTGAAESVPSPRELLDTEWEPCVGPVPRVIESKYAVFDLARRGGTVVVICEALVGVALPPYTERRRLHAEISCLMRRSGDVVVFTDAAHSGFVWTWMAGALRGCTRWIEYRAPERTAAIGRRMRRMPEKLRPANARAAAVDDPAELLRLLSSMFRGRGADAAPGINTLADRLAGADDVALTRRVWRSLGEIGLLDVDCRGGERLIRQAEILEPLYLACLDRMRSFADDARAARRGHRPEHLGDLRSMVEIAEDERIHRDPELFVRRIIVQRNLFGLAASKEDLETARARLSRHAGWTGNGLPAVDTNVVQLSRGIRTSARSIGRGVPSDRTRAWEHSSLGEESAMLSRAALLLRRRRLRGLGARREMAIGAELLERRRAELLDRLEAALVIDEHSLPRRILVNAALLRPTGLRPFHPIGGRA